MVVLADEDMKAVEDDNNGEVKEGSPSCVWLERRLEDKRISVYTLRCKSLVELDVRQTDRAPREQAGNRRQILEPVEHYRWPPLLDGQISQCRYGCRNGNTVVGNTGFAATKEEAWGLFVLRKSEQIP